MEAAAADPPLRLGISQCLLGEEVRWDGGHQRDPFLMQTVGPFVEWIPVCPEMEVGMGVPREAVRLVRNGSGAPLMVGRDTGKGWTAPMQKWAKRRVRELGGEDLDAFVLKRGSPSCGMERVKVYGPKGMPLKNGRGMFAAELMDRHPLLPTEEDGRLNDPVLRDNFLVRAFAFRRLKGVFRGRWTPGDLVRFHTREKMLLHSHDIAGYRALGRLVADPKAMPRAELGEQYQTLYMKTLSKRATRRRHVDTMQHMQGHLKKLLTAEEKHELVTLIEDYRNSLVPLIVPLTMIRHYVRMHKVAYLQDQVYLEPAPKELMLRNHV